MHMLNNPEGAAGSNRGLIMSNMSTYFRLFSFVCRSHVFVLCDVVDGVDGVTPRGHLGNKRKASRRIETPWSRKRTFYVLIGLQMSRRERPLLLKHQDTSLPVNKGATWVASVLHSKTSLVPNPILSVVTHVLQVSAWVSSNSR